MLRIEKVVERIREIVFVICTLLNQFSERNIIDLVVFVDTESSRKIDRQPIECMARYQTMNGLLVSEK